MSRIRADRLVSRAGNSAPELTYGASIPVGYGITGAGGINITGIITATTFVGALTGTASNVTTNANLTGHVTSVGNAAVLGSFTSLQLLTALTDETGSGANVFATSPTLVTPVLGTPSSGTLTNCTGLPISTGVSGLAANIATFLAIPSSANLAAALTDDTGSGAAVFATSPVLVTPSLGAATATSIVVGSGVTINSSGINASGIVTALGGIRGIGIYSGGNLVTTGIITALNFIGTGNTFSVTNNKIDISIAGGSGGSQVSVGTESPAAPSSGNLWYNTNLGRTFIYYNDGDSSQWVDAAPFNIVSDSGGGASVSIGTEAPVGPSSGDLWYNADYARIFIYYDNGINSQWVDAAPFNFGIITSLEGLTVTGILTATSGFSGNLTGNATGLSGTPNLTVGIVTATTFVGALTGTATTAQGLTGTPNLSVGIVTATSFSGDGSALTGIANTANIVSTAITTGTLNTNTFTATGQSIINRVAISTVGVNTTLETGRTYVYFVGVTSLTLPPSPVVGDTLKIINRSGITTALILRNGSNIMGVSDDLEFDELDGSFTFTFTNSSEGWTLG